MQLASSTHVPDGLLATLTLLSEKPRHGVTTNHAASLQGIDGRNSTALIGLRFQCYERASATVVAPNNGKCLSNVGSFVNQYQANAQTLANSLGNGVTAAEVLAVAGNESTYGTSSFAAFGNFFGLHGNGPAGTYYTTQNHTAVMMFNPQGGFMASGQVFVSRVGPFMTPGLGANPFSFFSVLNQHGYATGNSAYPGMMTSTSPRGPYTLVSACMAGQ